MKEYNRNALMALKADLKLCVKISIRLLDELPTAAGGFLSSAEVMEIQNKPNDPARMGQLVEILQGKTNGDFKVFCKLLRKCNYGVWADELEEKAQEFGGPGMHLRGRI